jgi:hypothetical protein
MQNKYFTKSTLFFIIVLFFLLQIWIHRYFVTGDGPCHVYNSKILLDYMLHRDTDFYNQWYDTNATAFPNWFSHVLLSLLLFVSPPHVADKILLSLYILMASFGWRYLIHQIKEKYHASVFLGLLFVFHHVFLMGFYNYSFSVAMFFWIAGYFYKNKNDMSLKSALFLGFATVLLYFMHPTGIVLLVSFIGCNILVDTFYDWKTGRFIFKNSIFLVSKIGIIILPAAFLLVHYLLEQPASNAVPQNSILSLFSEMKDLTALVTISHREVWLARVIFWGSVVYLSTFIWYRSRKNQFFQYDALSLFTVLLFLFYFFQPGGIGGGLMIPQRIQFLPFLGILIWSSGYTLKPKINTALIYFACISIGVFGVIRYKYYHLASDYMTEVQSVAKSVKPRSVMMVLNYDLGCTTPKGAVLGSRIWLQPHMASYIGATKPLIVATNYEALQNYFPLKWKSTHSILNATSTPNGNMFGIPPSVDLTNFSDKIKGQTLDYVLVVGIDDYTNPKHPDVQNVLVQLEQKYELVDASPRKVARLYKIKQ